jgi:hypothetical protein
MKTLLAIVLMLVGFLCKPATAQTYVIVEPSGGMTVDYLMARSDEWQIVVFQTGVTELDTSCSTINSATLGYGSYAQNRRVVWIQPSIAGRTRLFNQLALTQALGKKVVGITIDTSPGSYCVLVSARTAP